MSDLRGYDDWKSRPPDEPCVACNGEGWIEIAIDIDEVRMVSCTVCRDDGDRLDREDDALPTEDTTGVREPD